MSSNGNTRDPAADAGRSDDAARSLRDVGRMVRRVEEGAGREAVQEPDRKAVCQGGCQSDREPGRRRTPQGRERGGAAGRLASWRASLFRSENSWQTVGVLEIERITLRWI